MRDPLAAYVRALREADAPDAALRSRIMDAVRREAKAAPPARSRRPAVPAPTSATHALRMLPRRTSRGPALSALTAFAVAAGIAAVVTLGPAPSRAALGSVRTVGTLDTVAATIRDTVRLVQFMLVAPTASRVALAGDFNAWDPKATPLRRSSHDAPWTVALDLPPGRHRYAFVVDDSQWVEGTTAVGRE
jgi:hypothetical protein